MLMKKCFVALPLLLFAGTAAAHDEPVIGSLAGAGIGAAIAGPPGAAVGAVVGAIAGSTYAHETDHHHHDRRGNGGYAWHHNHVHFAPVGYRGNGKGATVYCEPRNGYHKPTVVRVEERPVTVRTVTTKTQMRKVCRYEPVRTTRVTERRVTERVALASR